MPKLWTATIAAHHREVRDAILDTTVRLAARHGVRGVTMSQIAETAGIGRATLYKYFPDVDAILVAWHQRQLDEHLELLCSVRERSGDPCQKLEAVLATYATIQHRLRAAHRSALAAHLHEQAHVAATRQRLSDLIRDVIAEAAAQGRVRSDVAPAELASFCLHALAAAATLGSPAAVQRLVDVTLAGLRVTAGAGAVRST
ncbi:MAG: TetR/AcrR family transcriptional regulator [Candidatus Dormibacteria bacterium]